MKLRTAVVLLSICVLTSGAAMAQGKCTAQTIKGTYSVTCNGFVAPGPGAPATMPYAGQGTIGTEVVNGQAVISGGAKLNIGGMMIVDGPVFAGPGDVTIKPDCTGQVVYNRGIVVNGQSVQLDIDFNVLDDGKEIRGFITTAGYVATCNLRLMSRELNR